MRRIFEAKGRPQDNPLILHIPQADWLERTVLLAVAPLMLCPGLLTDAVGFVFLGAVAIRQRFTRLPLAGA